MIHVVCWLAALAGVTVAVLAHAGGRPIVHAIGKMTASASFLAYAWQLDLWNAGPHGPWFVGALIFSAVGDACLIGTSKAWFLSGLIAFLLGHLGYAAGTIALGVGPVALGLGGLLLVPLGVVVLDRLLPAAGKLATPTALYAFVILAMGALAIGHGWSSLDGARRLLPWAALLFIVSDLFVARQRFLAVALVNRAVGLPLYFTAQLLFVLAGT